MQNEEMFRVIEYGAMWVDLKAKLTTQGSVRLRVNSRLGHDPGVFV